MNHRGALLRRRDVGQPQRSGQQHRHQRGEDERQIVGDDLVDRAHRGQQRVLVVRSPAGHEQPDDFHRRDREEEQDADVEVGDAEPGRERDRREDQHARDEEDDRRQIEDPAGRPPPARCLPSSAASRRRRSAAAARAARRGRDRCATASAPRTSARAASRTATMPMTRRDNERRDDAASTAAPGAGQGHRSTSPKTGSTEPMIATTSATLMARNDVRQDRQVRERRAAPLHAVRLALPSATM